MSCKSTVFNTSRELRKSSLIQATHDAPKHTHTHARARALCVCVYVCVCIHIVSPLGLRFPCRSRARAFWGRDVCLDVFTILLSLQLWFSWPAAKLVDCYKILSRVLHPLHTRALSVSSTERSWTFEHLTWSCLFLTPNTSIPVRCQACTSDVPNSLDFNTL